MAEEINGDFNPFDEYWTPEETAREARVSLRTLQRWERQRVGPPRTKLLKQVWYRKKSVRDWLLAHEREPGR